MLGNIETLKICRICADEIIAEDEGLDMPKHKAIADKISDMFRNSIAN
jgi:hypothetical protein